MKKTEIKPKPKNKGLSYLEAEKESLKVKWKISTCGSGESCWCRIIVPVKKIKLADGGYYDCIVSMGAIHKHLAEYIVKLHNEKIEIDEKK